MHITSAETWVEQVREVGLRATPGRIAALRFLAEHPHSTAAEVHAGISDDLPSVSMQSVHNVVNDLSARGVLRRIDMPGTGGARYETRTADNHHHMQCVICGRIEDVECVVGHAPCLTPSQTHGMHTVLSADVTFRAVCTDCAERTEQAALAHAAGRGADAGEPRAADAPSEQSTPASAVPPAPTTRSSPRIPHNSEASTGGTHG